MSAFSVSDNCPSQRRWGPLEQGFGYQLGACVYRYDSLNGLLWTGFIRGNGRGHSVSPAALGVGQRI
jgi:hypothetical protein